VRYGAERTAWGLAALRLVERRLKVAVVGNGLLLDEVRREAERGRHTFRLYPSASEEEKRRVASTTSICRLRRASA
jgi:hypothetical protein